MRLVPNSTLSAANACDGPSRPPTGRCAAQERDVDARDLILAELQVAHAVAAVLCRAGCASDERADPVADHRGLALGEDARLRGSDAGHVADRVHAGKRRLERQRVDRDPAVDSEPRLLDHQRGPVHGTPRKRSYGISVPSLRRATLRAGSSAADQPFGVPVDATLGEGDEQRLGRSRATAGWGSRNGITSEISDAHAGHAAAR